ncbi:MAG: cation:proton antiporter [Bdellovibrionales bacterium]|nr:cation:proton antiporter [Bdellovibrionales bacterium]
MSFLDLKHLTVFIAFILVALAADRVGKFVTRFGFPQLSGLILTGLLASPHIFSFIKHEDIEALRFIDLIALPFIAFAAGAEVHLAELKRKFKTIILVIFSIVAIILSVGTFSFTSLSDSIPFLAGRDSSFVWAISLLGACIMIAKSPSSLVAIIKELRGQGSFVQTALGATVLMDAVVIVLFAVCISASNIIFEGSLFDFSHLLLLLAEIIYAAISGIVIAWVLSRVLRLNFSVKVKAALLVLISYLISYTASIAANHHLPIIPIKPFSEPLLVCMVAGFLVANFSRYSTEFKNLIEDLSEPIFMLFFTALGASLDISFLKDIWDVALLLAGIRLVSMIFACYIGGTVSGLSQKHSRVLGFAFITQAGISISLAKEVEFSYPGWGSEFATLMVGIIVINTMIGPWFTKFAIQLVGEAHSRSKSKHSRARKVVIFGVENHSLALARTLQEHHWKVILADTKELGLEARELEKEFSFFLLKNLSLEEITKTGAGQVDTIVCLLDTDSNYKICNLAYEHFGTEHLIARIPDGLETSKFYQLGVMVIEPGSAMLNLLDHCIRSPSALSLVLGQDKNHDIIEVEVSNPDIVGLAIRDLSLPSDVIVLSVKRGKQLIFTHGYTRFKLRDEVTLVGSNKSLTEICDRFDIYTSY